MRECCGPIPQSPLPGLTLPRDRDPAVNCWAILSPSLPGLSESRPGRDAKMCRTTRSPDPRRPGGARDAAAAALLERSLRASPQSAISYQPTGSGQRSPPRPKRRHYAIAEAFRSFPDVGGQETSLFHTSCRGFPARCDLDPGGLFAPEGARESSRGRSAAEPPVSAPGEMEPRQGRGRRKAGPRGNPHSSLAPVGALKNGTAFRGFRFRLRYATPRQVAPPPATVPRPCRGCRTDARNRVPAAREAQMCRTTRSGDPQRRRWRRRGRAGRPRIASHASPRIPAGRSSPNRRLFIGAAAGKEGT